MSTRQRVWPRVMVFMIAYALLLSMLSPRTVLPPLGANTGSVTGAMYPADGPLAQTVGGFVMLSGNMMFSCSGAIVEDRNPDVSTVVTAAHCVFPFPGLGHDQFFDEVIFIPGKRLREYPGSRWIDFVSGCTFDPMRFNCWSSRGIAVTEGWAHATNTELDVAFVTFDASLEATHGASPIAFQTSFGREVAALGYPGEPADRYSGHDLIWCRGPSGLRVSSGALAVECDMGPGASGGPWFADINGQATVITISTYRMVPGKWLFAPYFTYEVERAYDYATAGLGGNAIVAPY